MKRLVCFCFVVHGIGLIHAQQHAAQQQSIMTLNHPGKQSDKREKVSQLNL
jgi:hypothetical protein